MSNEGSPVEKSRFLSLRWRLVKPWLGVAGLVGLGLLPCPDCGAPMIIHFWPVAIVLAFRNLVRKKRQKSDITSPKADESCTINNSGQKSDLF